MRALLVYPEYPGSYWGAQYALRLIGKKAASPPLGLITMAALLPPEIELRLVDVNVRELTDDDLRWADVVMLSGMLIQRPSFEAIALRCRGLGVPTVAGGPMVSSIPDALAPVVDHLVLGEAETSLAPFLDDLRAGLGALRPRYEAGPRPEMAMSPVPRFDLLDVNAYVSMAMQFSRGCPFNCEFCDIIELYGRKPRTKGPAQLLVELDALYRTGFRGQLFFVDDNFIGNKHRAREVLPEIAAWQKRHGVPFDLYTEATVNLALDERLLRLMVEAGFSMVFIGIETPSLESLEETQKYQNMAVDLEKAVRDICAAGLEVAAGFIVGFDSDDETIFDRQIAFIRETRIPMAMVGILNVPPGTQLERRLLAEGRLLGVSDGDAVGIDLTNFVTRMDPDRLRAGYARVLESIYEPEAYFERCLGLFDALGPARVTQYRRPLDGYALRVFLSALWEQGVRAPYRRAYWRYLAQAVRRAPARLGDAISKAIAGHHFISYTEHDVLPKLRANGAARKASRRSDEASRPRRLRVLGSP